MKLSEVLELIILGAIWGASFMLMKTTVDEFGVFALVELRAALAALFLLPFVLLLKQFADLLLHWRKLLVVGALNTAIPFCLFAYATVHLDSGLTAILNGTAPMFGAIVAYFYLSERIGKVGVFGICLGFCGVLLISAQSKTGADISLLPVLCSLGATLCYGLAACYMKKHLVGVKPFAVAAGSQVFSAIMIFPLALYYWPASMPSHAAWRDALLLALMCTGLAYVLYFDLIAKIGASKTITVAYLVPLFGILWGVLLLQERLSNQSIVGGVLIICGVMLTTGIVNKLKRL